MADWLSPKHGGVGDGLAVEGAIPVILEGDYGGQVIGQVHAVTPRDMEALARERLRGGGMGGRWCRTPHEGIAAHPPRQIRLGASRSR